MSFAKIRPRRGTASQWATIDPVLVEGEIGIEVPDTGVGTGLVKIKFGDGVKKWSELPYGVIDGLSSDDIVNNAVTDNPGKIASASVAKNLQDQIDVINNAMSKKYISSTDVYIDNYISNDGLRFWVIEYTDYVLVSIVAKLNEILNIDGWTTVISGLPNVSRPTPLNIFNSVAQTRDITVVYMNDTIVFVTQKDIGYVVEGDYVYISGVVVK